MDLARARFLVSRAGREALAALDPGLAALPPTALADHLRRTFAPAEASALAEQLVLRARAADRFDGPVDLLLSPAGLEMMTHPAVAARRAARFARLALPVADLTCGLGGDLRALAEEAPRALGLERDPPTALLAAANVPRADVLLGHAARPPVRLDRAALFLDPSRRGAAGRRFDPAAFSPPWEVALALAGAAHAACIKVAPGIEERHLPPAAEVEFVQLGRTLREAAAWLGGDAVPGLRRAVLLPAGAELDSTAPEAPAELLPPGAFLFDPESCVTRAGLVRHLAARLGARLMDPQVAYLTADRPAFDPLAATFAVLDVVPFSVARLRALLRERRWRPDEIRRRAFPVEPDALRRLLGPLEGEPVTLLCTTLVGRRRTVLVGRRLDESSTGNCAGV